MAGQHADIVPLESVASYKRRKGGKYLDTKGRIGIYDGTKLKSERGRERSKCKECGGSGIYEHDMVVSRCMECGGSGICEHGSRRCKCKECNARFVAIS